jgi:putative hemolysin
MAASGGRKTSGKTEKRQKPVSSFSLTIGIFALIILAIIVFLACYNFSQGRIACTADAKICLDGTAVGRTAPNCEFAPCPGIANPASENCVARGGTLRIENSPAGQVGICALPGGVECDEWALFRGTCPVDETACISSSDCAPITNCHPESCINRAYVKPSGIACTLNCQTPLDCGAAACECVSGKCAVVPAV